MKPRLGTVILLVSMVCGTASARTGVIDIADYKGRYDTRDMTPFVYTLLESLPADKPVKLVFPQGTYHFRPEFAAGKYHCITNHDNGYRHFAFPLTGRRNIEIDGGGAEFIFHGRIIPFLIEDSHGVTLRNFTVDWEVPFTLEAKVTAADAETQRIEIEIPDEFGHAVENGKLIMRAEGWEERIPGENIVFDPGTMATAYRSDDYYIPKPDNFDIRVTPTAPGRYELHTRFVRALPPVGTILTFKGVFTQNRHSPAIHATASSGVLVEDVTIHHCSGMGLIAEKTDNVTVRRLQVVLRKGSPRMITTTADATHFCNCRGTVLIEECVFENMLDDATNVHGSYVRVTGITAPDQVIARINHPQQAGYEFAGKGDEIDVVDAETLLTKHTLRVKKSERINAHYIRLTFTAPVEGRLTVGDGLENMSWYPELIFRNNVVRN
ncbi:right-handed parallel beta-helix repeat-containing protein, partial [Alistipes finegoldii]|uniref:alpha-1,3-galactosidase-related protein n=1 Tax=Alistipes finegoldii TaxID=214856 RepID=UPI0025A175E7